MALSNATPILFPFVMIIDIRYWISRTIWKKNIQHTYYIHLKHHCRYRGFFCKIVFLERTGWKYSNLDVRFGNPIFRFILRANRLGRWSFGKQVGYFLSVYFWAQYDTATICCCTETNICLNPSTERVGILASPMYHVCEVVCFLIRQCPTLTWMFMESSSSTTSLDVRLASTYPPHVILGHTRSVH